jgi:predicted DNA-binding protein (MmcQ/YjbR family)
VTATPRAVYERPVFARTRRLCLALPETVERSAWGHPTFRAGRKTFCTFENFHGRPSIAFRLPSTEVTNRLRRKPFFETPYGRGLWVSLWVDGIVDHHAIATLVDQSYRTVALKRMVRALGAANDRGRG